MKRWQLFLTSLLGLLMWGAAVASPAWSLGRGEGFRPYLYAPCQIKGTCKPFDETGKVAQVLTENLESGRHDSMAIVLDSKTQPQAYVHLGPVWYLERHGFELFPGDVVEVKGVCETETEEKEGLRAIAYELIKGNHVLRLRDSEGHPNW